VNYLLSSNSLAETRIVKNGSYIREFFEMKCRQNVTLLIWDGKATLQRLSDCGDVN
jgi:hypothetical protein